MFPGSELQFMANVNYSRQAKILEGLTGSVCFLVRPSTSGGSSPECDLPCYTSTCGFNIQFLLRNSKYADKIYGIIACCDRMIIQGYIPNWSHADAMTAYMKANGIRIFDYPDFSQPLTEQVRQNTERIASENGIEIEFIRKLHAFRKDDRIQKTSVLRYLR